MDHTCHAERCTVEVHPKLFMCKRHWNMLPNQMRRLIWSTYRSGQEIDKTPSKKYMEVTRAAIDWLLEKEYGQKTSGQPTLF